MAYKNNKPKGKTTDENIQKVADTFIKALNENNAPWQKTWNPIFDRMDFNMFTMKNNDKSYQGVNSVNTYVVRKAVLKTEDPRWMTMGALIKYNQEKFKEKKEDYYYVRNGESATPVFFHTMLYFDKDGKKLDPQKLTSEELKEKTVKNIPFFTHEYVFNASQTARYVFEDGKIKKDKDGNFIYKEGIPYDIPKEEIEKKQKEYEEKKWINDIEKYIKDTGIQIKNDNPSGAHYNTGQDMIHVPPKETFINMEEYYQTLFHEMTHWTGTKSRLNRSTLSNYSKDIKERAKEELVAEIGGYMMCQHFGIMYNPNDNNKAYVNYWIEHLEKEPKFIIEASNNAQKALNYLTNVDELVKNETDKKINENDNKQINDKGEEKGRSR